jgi:hypothetical protein
MDRLKQHLCESPPLLAYTSGPSYRFWSACPCPASYPCTDSVSPSPHSYAREQRQAYSKPHPNWTSFRWEFWTPPRIDASSTSGCRPLEASASWPPQAPAARSPGPLFPPAPARRISTAHSPTLDSTTVVRLQAMSPNANPATPSFQLKSLCLPREGLIMCLNRCNQASFHSRHRDGTRNAPTCWDQR